MKSSQADQVETVSELLCIGADGKEDKDLLIFKEIIEDNEPKLLRVKEKEHHLWITAESGENRGSYLAHKTLPRKGATGQVQALKILEVLEEYNSKNTILAVLLDNTAVNTGFKGGIVAWLEKSLERKLHLIGCTLHQN